MEEYSVKAVLSAHDAGFTKGMQAAQKSASSLGDKLKSGLGFGVLSGIGMGAVRGITGMLGGLGTAVGKATERVDTLNNFTPIMKNLGYSAKDANKSLDLMVKGIDGLPTSLDQISNATTKIAPLTGNLRQATKISLAMNNALLAGGKSAEAQANGLEQYSQMLSAGRVDMQSWRSLLDAMPAQLNQLSVKLLGAGKNQNDLRLAMQSGKVTFNDFNKALLELNDKGLKGFGSFKQQAATATQGIQTGITNLKTSITKGLANSIKRADQILKSNGFGGFKENLDRLKGWVNSAFNSLNNSKGFKLFVTSIAKGIKTIGSNIGTITKIAGALLGLNIVKTVGSNFLTAKGHITTFLGILRGTPATAEAASSALLGLPQIFQTLHAGIEKAQTGLDFFSQKLNLTKGISLGAVGTFGALALGIGAIGIGIYKNATAHHRYSDAVEETRLTGEKRLKSVERENATIDFYMSQLDNLSGKENKTAADKQRMATLVEMLNGKVQGLNLVYDAEKDKLNQTTQEIHKKIDAMKKEAYIMANRKGLEDTVKQEVELTEKRKKALNEIAVLEKQIEDYKASGGGKTMQDPKMSQMEKDLAKAKRSLDGLDDALLKNRVTAGLWEAKMLQAEGNVKGALSKLSAVAKDMGYEVPKELADGIKSGNIAIPTSLKEWETLIQTFGGSASKKAKAKGSEAGSNFSSGISSKKGSANSSGLGIAGSFINGLFSKTGSARTAGHSLGSNAKSGTQSGASGSFGVGSYFGQGFYDGIAAWKSKVGSVAETLGNMAMKGLKAIGVVRSPSHKMREIGEYYGMGFTLGMGSYRANAYSAGVRLGKAADSGITNEAEIHSPSKKAKKRGKSIGRGLSIGIAKSTKLVQTASKKLIKGLIFNSMKAVTKKNLLSQRFESTAKNSVDTFSKTLKSRVSNAITKVNKIISSKTKKWTTISKSTKKRMKSSKAYKKQITKLNAAYKSLGKTVKSKFSSQIKSQMNKAISKVNSRLNDLGKKYQAKYDAILSSRSTFVEQMRSYGSLYSTDSYGFSWLTNFKELNTQNTRLQSKLKSLQKIIGTSQKSRTFLDQITSMEPAKAIPFLDKLLQKSSKDIKTYYSEFNKYWDTASSIGTGIYAPYIKGLDTEYNKELKKVISKLNKDFNSIGRQAVNGLISGVKDKKNQKKLKSAASTLAKLIKSEVKKQLKIKSPSRVMARLGKYTGEGYLQGLISMYDDVRTAMQEIVSVPGADGLALAGDFNGELSNAYSYFGKAEYTVVVPINVKDREVAKVIAPIVEQELGKMQVKANRKRGIR